MPSSLQPCHLSEHNIPEISEFLGRIWPSLYGGTGCPVFSENYLHWLYGGPHRADHFLFGYRSAGVLVGFKANLFRSGFYRGLTLRSHIATHLAIETGLDMGTRFQLARTLSSLHTLTDEDAGMPAPKGSLSLAFFEDGKAVARNSRQIHDSLCIRTTSKEFQQAVVDRFTLQKFVPPFGVNVRTATESDCHSLFVMLRQLSPSGFCWNPTVEAMTHHFFSAPEARVWLAESQGAAVGFLAGYTLEWIRQGKASKMFIVEALATQREGVAASLLLQASSHALSERLRGVVIENPTYLMGEDLAACGIVITPRKMIAVARAAQDYDDLLEAFFCDVK